MKGERLKVLRGSGNIFRDLGQDNADVKQLKALLAAEIIKTLDRDPSVGAPGICAHRHRRGRFFLHPQRGSRALHARPAG